MLRAGVLTAATAVADSAAINEKEQEGKRGWRVH
jgi:hypothetical protein